MVKAIFLMNGSIRIQTLELVVGLGLIFGGTRFYTGMNK